MTRFKRHQQTPPTSGAPKLSHSYSGQPATTKRRVLAQRKFAQGAAPLHLSGATSRPASLSGSAACCDAPDCGAAVSVATSGWPDNGDVRFNGESALPCTQDFIKFLCFRGSDLMPKHLDQLFGSGSLGVSSHNSMTSSSTAAAGANFCSHSAAPPLCSTPTALPAHSPASSSAPTLSRRSGPLLNLERCSSSASRRHNGTPKHSPVKNAAAATSLSTERRRCRRLSHSSAAAAADSAAVVRRARVVLRRLTATSAAANSSQKSAGGGETEVRRMRDRIQAASRQQEQRRRQRRRCSNILKRLVVSKTLRYPSSGPTISMRVARQHRRVTRAQLHRSLHQQQQQQRQQHSGAVPSCRRRPPGGSTIVTRASVSGAHAAANWSQPHAVADKSTASDRLSRSPPDVTAATSNSPPSLSSQPTKRSPRRSARGAAAGHDPPSSAAAAGTAASSTPVGRSRSRFWYWLEEEQEGERADEQEEEGETDSSPNDGDLGGGRSKAVSASHKPRTDAPAANIGNAAAAAAGDKPRRVRSLCVLSASNQQQQQQHKPQQRRQGRRRSDGARVDAAACKATGESVDAHRRQTRSSGGDAVTRRLLVAPPQRQSVVADQQQDRTAGDDRLPLRRSFVTRPARHTDGRRSMDSGDTQQQQCRQPRPRSNRERLASKYVSLALNRSRASGMAAAAAAARRTARRADTAAVVSRFRSLRLVGDRMARCCASMTGAADLSTMRRRQRRRHCSNGVSNEARASRSSSPHDFESPTVRRAGQSSVPANIPAATTPSIKQLRRQQLRRSEARTADHAEGNGRKRLRPTVESVTASAPCAGDVKTRRLQSPLAAATAAADSRRHSLRKRDDLFFSFDLLDSESGSDTSEAAAGDHGDGGSGGSVKRRPSRAGVGERGDTPQSAGSSASERRCSRTRRRADRRLCVEAATALVSPSQLSLSQASGSVVSSVAASLTMPAATDDSCRAARVSDNAAVSSRTAPSKRPAVTKCGANDDCSSVAGAVCAASTPSVGAGQAECLPANAAATDGGISPDKADETQTKTARQPPPPPSVKSPTRRTSLCVRGDGRVKRAPFLCGASGSGFLSQLHASAQRHLSVRRTPAVLPRGSDGSGGRSNRAGEGSVYEFDVAAASARLLPADAVAVCTGTVAAQRSQTHCRREISANGAGSLRVLMPSHVSCAAAAIASTTAPSLASIGATMAVSAPRVQLVSVSDVRCSVPVPQLTRMPFDVGGAVFAAPAPFPSFVAPPIASVLPSSGVVKQQQPALLAPAACAVRFDAATAPWWPQRQQQVAFQQLLAPTPVQPAFVRVAAAAPTAAGSVSSVGVGSSLRLLAPAPPPPSAAAAAATSATPCLAGRPTVPTVRPPLPAPAIARGRPATVLRPSVSRAVRPVRSHYAPGCQSAALVHGGAVSHVTVAPPALSRCPAMSTQNTAEDAVTPPQVPTCSAVSSSSRVGSSRSGGGGGGRHLVCAVGPQRSSCAAATSVAAVGVSLTPGRRSLPTAGAGRHDGDCGQSETARQCCDTDQKPCLSAQQSHSVAAYSRMGFSAGESAVCDNERDKLAVKGDDRLSRQLPDIVRLPAEQRALKTLSESQSLLGSGRVQSDASSNLSPSNNRLINNDAAAPESVTSSCLVTSSARNRSVDTVAPSVRRHVKAADAGASSPCADVSYPLRPASPGVSGHKSAAPTSVAASDGASSRDAGTSSVSMTEAPVFYPTVDEFDDPLRYLQSIWRSVEQHGLCRIVPPSSFKPECRVDDSMRFVVYNHYIHKVYQRWGGNFRQLLAIRKYLQQQDIEMNDIPQVGGVELDLPRLYEAVHRLGGLNSVIASGRWSTVAEHLGVTRATNTATTNAATTNAATAARLDTVYCKYLLGYTALSDEERRRLHNEVEAEWHCRARNNLRARLDQDDDADDDDATSDEDGENDGDDDANECIVKGKTTSLAAFYRVARNLMAGWYKQTQPSVSQVENDYWKVVRGRDRHVCVYSGSLDCIGGGVGSDVLSSCRGVSSASTAGATATSYGFTCDKHSPTGRSPWNLKLLGLNGGSVLRWLGHVPGVTVPTMHMAMLFSTGCWYCDPRQLPWLEYLHTGADKIWYSVPESDGAALLRHVAELMPQHVPRGVPRGSAGATWLPADTAMVPPHELCRRGVRVCRSVQRPGEFVVCAGGVFSSHLTTGYTLSESVYFATADWLHRAARVFSQLRVIREPGTFSLHQLVLNICAAHSATSSSSSSSAPPDRHTLALCRPLLQQLAGEEHQLVERLAQLGVRQVGRLLARPPPGSAAVARAAKCRPSDGSQASLPTLLASARECELCNHCCYASMVEHARDDVVYCLRDAVRLIQRGRVTSHELRLSCMHSQEDYNEILADLDRRIQTISS